MVPWKHKRQLSINARPSFTLISFPKLTSANGHVMEKICLLALVPRRIAYKTNARTTYGNHAHSILRASRLFVALLVAVLHGRKQFTYVGCSTTTTAVRRLIFFILIYTPKKGLTMRPRQPSTLQENHFLDLDAGIKHYNLEDQRLYWSIETILSQWELGPLSRFYAETSVL